MRQFILIFPLVLVSALAGYPSAAGAAAPPVARSAAHALGPVPALRPIRPTVLPLGSIVSRREARARRVAPILRPAAGTARRTRDGASCQPNGTPRGLPYLNEFYTGFSDPNTGNCTFSIQPVTVSSSTVWTGSPVLMESSVTINQGVTVELSGTLDDNPGTGVSDLVVAGTLKLDAGSGLLFTPAPSTGLCNCGIFVSGTLNAEGTGDDGANPVRMDSGPLAGSPGQWLGMAFYNGGGGTMTYLHIANAGAGIEGCARCGGLPNEDADILISGGTPDIEHASILDSAGNGIEVLNGGHPTLQSDSFARNTGYPVQYDTPSDLSALHNLVAGTGPDANGHDALRMAGGNLGENATWPGDLGLSLSVGGQFAVNSGYRLYLGPDLTIESMAGSLIDYLNASLYIDHGVTIRFVPGCNCGLHAYSNGYGTSTLTIAGTKADHVVFTSAGSTPAPGDWAGLDINAAANELNSTAGAEIDYLDVLYAGSGTLYPCDICQGYAVGFLLDGYTPDLSNVISSHGGGNGIEVAGGNPTISTAGLDYNADAPLVYDFFSGLENVTSLAATGNGTQEIVLRGGTLTDPAADWPDLGVPYAVDTRGNRIDIQQGGSLTIDKDVTVASWSGNVYVDGDSSWTIGQGVQFNSISAEFAVRGGTLTVGQDAVLAFASGTLDSNAGYGAHGLGNGTVNLNGAAGHPITFTSVHDLVGSNVTPQAGDWGGMALTATNVTFSYVHERYGGAGSCEGCGPVYDGAFFQNASGTVDHSAFDDNAGSGLESTYSTLTLTNDSFDGNTGYSGDTVSYGPDTSGYAVVLDQLPGDLSGWSTLEAQNNRHDEILIRPRGSFADNGIFTWPDLGVPYHIADGTNPTPIYLGSNSTWHIGAGAHFAYIGGNIEQSYQPSLITIGPGAVFAFGCHCGFRLNYSNIQAIGDAAHPITFTSAATNPAAGDWTGFHLNSSGDVIKHAIIRYAGYSWPTCDGYCSTYSAAVHIGDQSPDIENTVIQDSAGNDVEVSSGTPTLLNNSFLVVPNGYFGVKMDQSNYTVTAQENWWGSPDGPSVVTPMQNPAPGVQTGTRTAGTRVSSNVDYSNWLTAPPGPTYIPVRGLRVTRNGGRSILRWRLAGARGVLGFNIYAGHTRLNRRLILVHPAPRYRFTLPPARGTLTLHIITAGGEHILPVHG